jgi:pseudaminic acid cytidylyltransferase
MASICIIPARAGSKRIPRKNVKHFLGKPIIAYSIEAAIASGLFAEVMVSTDDVEIAKIAKKYGAKVPFFRSSENSNDFATTFDVIEEVIQEYQKLDKKFDSICCIYACAPFITAIKLNSSYLLMQNMGFDSVFPIMEYGYPIQRALKIFDEKVSFINPEVSLSRSQDLDKSYHDAGQFYWMNSSIILRNKKILTSNSGGIIISELEGQDIDNEIDWKIAELKYELLQNLK